MGKKRSEMIERVSKAVSSFLRALDAVSYISEFHAISLTEKHIARENHFSRVLLSIYDCARICTRLHDICRIRLDKSKVEIGQVSW